MRKSAALFSLMALFACADAQASPISGSLHSNVLLLVVGMPESRVEQIVGAFQDEIPISADGERVCRSYLYDETIAPKYVHIVLVDGVVASASDGHAGFCHPSNSALIG